MFRHRLPVSLAAALLAAGVLAGCKNYISENTRADQKGVKPATITRLDPGAQAPASADATAPQDGYYELFRDGKPLARFHLKAGAPIGFATQPATKTSAVPKPGSVFAVGGEHDLLLDPNSAYEWRLVSYRKDPIDRWVNP